MNLILLTLMFIAIVLVVVGYIKATFQCPPRKIEYRYVPRSFIEEQKEPVPITDIFAKMFYEATPWISHEAGKLLGPPNAQALDINKHFISQA
jgi:hypothetical protein